MTKKDYVLKLLDKVAGSWSQAEAVKNYLSLHDDQSYIDYLYEKFVEAVDQTLHDQWQDKIKSLVSFLENIKQQELVDRQADEADLQKLDQLLQTL